MLSAEINKYVQIVWDYHHMHHELKKADAVLVLCSNDTRVAEYAAGLYLQGLAPWLIFSGSFGAGTIGIFPKPEAELFADIALNLGVPENAVLVENEAANTGENVSFTKALLEEKQIEVNTFILVQKPFMERRTFATFKKIWPEKDFIVTSPPIQWRDYPDTNLSEDHVINAMVGDLQRIRLYPDKGFQIYQEIPEEVWNAYQNLVAAGFDKRLVSE